MSKAIFQGNPQKHTDVDKQRFEEYAGYFERSSLPTELKLANFPKYVRRQDISRFLAKNELFKLQIDLPGVIVECGCYAGGGLLTYSQLSSIYEPYNHQRRIVGFDTFSGFPSTSEMDRSTDSNWAKGDLHVDDGIVSEISKAIELNDGNRALQHIPKTKLIVGDAIETIPKFIAENPHVVVSMLYLDFDLYAPTKAALEAFVSRMPRGAVLAFDELNAESFPGETIALFETIGIKSLALRKTIFDPYISYAVID